MAITRGFPAQEQKQASLQRKLNAISDTSTIAVRCQERKERKRHEAEQLEQLERERDIQRLAGKDRTSWVRSHCLLHSSSRVTREAKSQKMGTGLSLVFVFFH